MRSYALFGGAAALLFGASTAGAAVSVVVTDLGNPVSTGGTATTATAYQAYLLTITSTTGNITGIDFGGTTGSTVTGITGTLLQRATFDADTGDRLLSPIRPERNNSSNRFSLDSHILVPAVNTTPAAAPAENNNGINPAGAPADTTDDFGTGTSLTGTFGILTPNQSTTVELAYVVLPDGVSAAYSGIIATTGGPSLGDRVSGTIPEPATAGLAGAAGLLLAARRRRRRSASL